MFLLLALYEVGMRRLAVDLIDGQYDSERVAGAVWRKVEEYAQRSGGVSVEVDILGL